MQRSTTQKQKCPKCEKKTFQLWGENLEMGTCFHPACGLRMNLHIINFGIDYTTIMLERLFEASKENLLTPDSQGRDRQAYKYVTEERKISRCVIERSDVGVMCYLRTVIIKIINYFS